jgi:hypothetical protein
MMALFFGIIDFSFVVFIQSTFTHAVREGARFAVTYSPSYRSYSCTASQATCIARVVQDNAIGFLSGSKATFLKVNYYTANNLSSPVMTCTTTGCTQIGVLPQTLPSGKVVRYANQPGNIVEVQVTQYPWNWMVPLPGFSPGSGLTLGALGTDVLGGLPVGAITPPSP